MHKIILFPENLKKNLGFTSKFRYGQVTLNTGVFFYLALAISVDPDEMSCYAVFHLGLHCLPKHLFRSHQFTKG